MSGPGNIRLLLWGIACLWLPSLAQGALVIPGPSNSIQGPSAAHLMRQKRSTGHSSLVEVQSIIVNTLVTSRFAHTVVTSEALNVANTAQEIFFEVDLPQTAFISNFSMEIDCQVYVGVVKEKEEAKKQYQKAVSAGQTAGLVKASGRTMERFTVSVNIAAQSSVIFNLTYEELLQRKLGHYEIVLRFKPKQAVQKFQIVTNIYEPQGIAYVHVHSTFLPNDLLSLVEKTVSDKKAHICFSPTIDQQRKCPVCDGTIIDGDIIIHYDVVRSLELGEIQVVNGYFVHFFAPPHLPRLPKNVVFVIDVSGSIRGRKIQQIKDAMLEILDDLIEDDQFGLIDFNGRVRTWTESLSQATVINVAAAKNYVRQLSPVGSTNIHGALLRSVKMLKDARQNCTVLEGSIDMIILLTDGIPTAGVTDLQKIHEDVRNAIDGKIRLFSLQFGRSSNFTFLSILSKANRGFARKIFEDSDADLQLKGFYDEISSPLLSRVELRYPNQRVDSLTITLFDHLFNGSEIVVAGKIQSSAAFISAEVYGRGLVDDFGVQGRYTIVDWDRIYPNEAYIFGNFIERLWAYLTIQQLLEKSKSCTAEEESKAKAKALLLSLRYNFVTSLTSMVVTKPADDDDLADKLSDEERDATGNQVPPGPPRVRPPLSNNPITTVDGDPHFIIELPKKNDSLCFNINDTPGTIFNLVKDPSVGLVVNGQTIGDKMIPPDGTIKTYIGRIGIIHETLGLRMEVTTKNISLYQNDNEVVLQWSVKKSVKLPNVDLFMSKDNSLTIVLKDSVKFVILLHKVWEKHPYHQDYLGFYTLDADLLSDSAHGLLGQFYHGIEYKVTNLHEGEVPEKPDATMFVKGQELTVTRGWQRDYRKDRIHGEKIPCWFIHNEGAGVIDGDVQDYIVSDLFTIV